MTDAVKNMQCGTLHLDIAKNKPGGVGQAAPQKIHVGGAAG